MQPLLKLKWPIIGFIGGILYAFANFYLITPYYRIHYQGILLWGIQGMIFASTFIILTKLPGNGIIAKHIKGCLSGVASGIPNSIIVLIETFQTMQRANVFNEQLFRIRNLSEVGQYLIGCAIIGLIFASIFKIGDSTHCTIMD